MLIRFLESCAGVDFSYSAKQVAEVPDQLATGLINGNLAIKAEPSTETPPVKPKTEKATKKPKVETADKKP